MNFKQLTEEVAEEFGISEKLRNRAILYAESQHPTKGQQVNLKNELSPSEEVEMREMLRALFCLLFLDSTYRDELRKTFPVAGNN